MLSFVKALLPNCKQAAFSIHLHSMRSPCTHFLQAVTTTTLLTSTFHTVPASSHHDSATFLQASYSPTLPALFCMRRFVTGVRLKFWKLGYAEQRKKVAVDLSHYQNLERIAKEGKTAAVIEDDAGGTVFEGGRDAWYKSLLSALQELPKVS
jgi:hypothetical protein